MFEVYLDLITGNDDSSSRPYDSEGAANVLHDTRSDASEREIKQ